MNNQQKKEKAGRYYTLNETWLSDLAFFENEISFFEELLKKDLILSPNIPMDYTLHEFKIELEQLKLATTEVIADIHGNMKLLRQTLLKSEVPGMEVITATNERLRQRVVHHINRIKNFRSRLYLISKGHGIEGPETLLT